MAKDSKKKTQQAKPAPKKAVVKKEETQAVKKEETQAVTEEETQAVTEEQKCMGAGCAFENAFDELGSF